MYQFSLKFLFQLSKNEILKLSINEIIERQEAEIEFMNKKPHKKFLVAIRFINKRWQI